MSAFPFLSKKLKLVTGIALLVWGVFVSDWLWWNWLSVPLELAGLERGVLDAARALAFLFTAGVGIVWWQRARQASALTRCQVATVWYIPWWQGLVYGADLLGLDWLRVSLAQFGLAGAFLIGLAWTIRWVELRSEICLQRRLQDWLQATGRGAVLARVTTAEPVPNVTGRRIWNPLDPGAWYYGRQNQKLSQSIAVLSSYSIGFLLLFLLFNQISGCKEIYEMPAGGGEQKTITQTVKIQKVIKKKFVINPYSSIIFNPPPIDEVKLQLQEVTAHLYKVGYGSGDGAGFSGGTKRGKVRFIRLEYQGGDWDQDFGVGADQNMLIQYGVLTGHPVEKLTESRTIAQLRNFPLGKSPPVMYLTGQRNVTLSQSEVKILREYLLDKHGMIFCDNGGSQHFHNQFFALMRAVMPTIQPVRIPLDDVIHRVPFHLPFLPYVAPHGGRDAWGWKVDGRWVVYYHPGDIGDAWADDHAGVPREIYEACYQLGTNVLFYGHTEYNKWLDAQKKN